MLLRRTYCWVLAVALCLNSLIISCGCFLRQSAITATVWRVTMVEAVEMATTHFIVIARGTTVETCAKVRAEVFRPIRLLFH